MDTVYKQTEPDVSTNEIDVVAEEKWIAGRIIESAIKFNRQHMYLRPSAEDVPEIQRGRSRIRSQKHIHGPFNR